MHTNKYKNYRYKHLFIIIINIIMHKFLTFIHIEKQSHFTSLPLAHLQARLRKQRDSLGRGYRRE